jgi:hypothetical protein
LGVGSMVGPWVGPWVGKGSAGKGSVRAGKAATDPGQFAALKHGDLAGRFLAVLAVGAGFALRFPQTFDPAAGGKKSTLM